MKLATLSKHKFIAVSFDQCSTYWSLIPEVKIRFYNHTMRDYVLFTVRLFWLRRGINFHLTTDTPAWSNP